MGNTCTVYMHLFPDGRKYVGYTKCDVKTRWDHGMGYMSHRKVFDAILRYGWNDIKHYILLDGLDEQTAKLMEAALIKRWRTHKSGGYNTRLPSVDGLDEFEIPKFKKRLVVDTDKTGVRERVCKRMSRHDDDRACRLGVAVRLVETGEEFTSMSAAASCFGYTMASIAAVVDKPNRTCGTCVIEDPDSGVPREVRAHWVTVK